ncbi:MAG: gamma-glutamyltransferase family protein [Erysipelotrichaceae bacterium]|nr:gamma-glutamyltransferase family protein [Erysipelotrichaceae bacterium]
MAFKFDPKCYPYPSQKTVSYAKNGMVTTTNQLAAGVGIDILKKGGNAVDAAVATMITTTVVEPSMNSAGSDNFAIVWMKDKMYGMNSSGPCAKGLSIENLQKDGFDKMPVLGWHAVNIPGAPAGWKALSDRFGNLPFKDLFEYAIRYAEEGFPVTPQISTDWEGNSNLFRRCKEGPKTEGHPLTGLDEQSAKPFFDIYCPGGKAPKAGDLFKNPDYAKTLRRIAETGAEDFYRGETARAMVEFNNQCGGYWSMEDLEEYKVQWVDPIHVNYRGYDVWEIPPNGNGISLLMALNILKGFDLPENEKECARTYHLLFECMKLAYMDSKTYVTDPRYMTVTPEMMMDEGYAAKRRALIDLTKAIVPAPGRPDDGGTVYCATADKDGNMVSMIQSNFNAFGSGIAIPGCGFAMNNRGRQFTFDTKHANCLVGGKKSFHTIIPGFLTKDGKAVGPFGCVGGFIQPQGQLTLLTNMIDFNMNPQAAIDSPRWFWEEGKRIAVEKDLPEHIYDQLSRMGHDLVRGNYKPNMGRAQIILRDPETGVLCGACDKRADGVPAVY